MIKAVVLVLIGIYFTGCADDKSQKVDNRSCAGHQQVTENFMDSYAFFDDCTGMTRECGLRFNYFVTGDELHLTTTESLNGIPITCIEAKNAECVLYDLAEGSEMVCTSTKGDE